MSSKSETKEVVAVVDTSKTQKTSASIKKASTAKKKAEKTCDNVKDFLAHKIAKALRKEFEENYFGLTEGDMADFAVEFGELDEYDDDLPEGHAPTERHFVDIQGERYRLFLINDKTKVPGSARIIMTADADNEFDEDEDEDEDESGDDGDDGEAAKAEKET